jgi:hypothetical protein
MGSSMEASAMTDPSRLFSFIVPAEYIDEGELDSMAPAYRQE